MKGRRQCSGRYGKVYENILTKEFLIENYVNNHLTPYQIANMVKCTPNIVYTYIDNHNIPRIEFSKDKQLKCGDKYNMLKCIKVVDKLKNGTFIWKCKCDCGKYTNVPTSRIKNGKTKSCGCWAKRLKNHLWKGYCDISGSRVSEIRLRAKKKQIPFNLDAKFLWELYLQQDKKCAISKIDIVMNEGASLDRIDSSKGYTKDNVQWVHMDINKMKMDLSMEKFIDYCRIIVQANKG